jgi:hypothetical protein
VRRIYSGPGRTQRAVEKLAIFPNEAALSGAPEALRDIPCIYISRRIPREEFFTECPRWSDEAVRHGVVRREMVGQRRATAARQGLEGPGQGHHYRPGEAHSHAPKFSPWSSGRR